MLVSEDEGVEQLDIAILQAAGNGQVLLLLRRRSER